MDESKGKVFLHHRLRIILTVTIQYTIAVYMYFELLLPSEQFIRLLFYLHSLPTYPILNFADF